MREDLSCRRKEISATRGQDHQEGVVTKEAEKNEEKNGRKKEKSLG